MPAWTINNIIRTPLLLLAIVEVVVLFSSVYAGCIFLYENIAACENIIGPVVPRAAVFAVVILAALIAMGLFQFHQRLYFHEVFIRLVVGIALGSVALAAIYYAIPAIALPRSVSLVAVVYSLLAMLMTRFFFVRNVDENIFRCRTLVFGAGERANSISDLRRKADRRGFKIVGSVPAPGDVQVTDKNGLLIRDKSLSWLATELEADEIVIAMDDQRGNLPIRELLDCKLKGVYVIDLMEFLERESGKIRIDLVKPGWLIFSPGFRTSRFRRFIKRVLDLALGIIALLVSWPFMLAIAIAIKIEDGVRAPVLYRQKRVGAQGESFKVVKFRSMVENAEADGGAQWAEENDARITKVGAVLRKYRLDELPQLINVLRGQMSLVGPRPERPEFVEGLSESIPYYSERHTVKPGVTGWAQLRYSYGASEEDAAEKLQFDLYYVKNQNLFLDLVIILQTVEIVLWGKGAR
jgi:sugar transferase (PEP-CTERM system associated)